MMTEMRRKVALRIRSGEAPRPLLDLLSGRFRYHSREEWQRHIEQGRVLLNHCPAGPDTLPAPGDLLEYVADDIPEPPVDTDYSVLFEDEALMVVDKPGNLPCHPAGRYFNHTLWALLKTQKGLEYLSFVNRLDRETSGLVLIAKTPEDARACQAQFRAGQVNKRYMVLVEGRFPDREIKAQGYLAPDPDSPVRKKLRFYPAPAGAAIPAGVKGCRTLFRVTEVYADTSLVEAVPETGRLHQIRATLCSMGYPVVGDKIYGADERLFLRFIDDRLTSDDRRRLRLPRQALHAAALSLRHPRTGELLELKAPLPPDMKDMRMHLHTSGQP